MLDELRRKGTTTETPVQDFENVLQSPPVDRRFPEMCPYALFSLPHLMDDCDADIVTDFDGFLENLSRDIHHERELPLWEAIAATYSIARRSFDLDKTQKQTLFLLSASLGKPDERAIAALPQK
jgi:hypothetical protein